jgi:hypothetical protein
LVDNKFAIGKTCPLLENRLKIFLSFYTKVFLQNSTPSIKLLLLYHFPPIKTRQIPSIIDRKTISKNSYLKHYRQFLPLPAITWLLFG